MSEPTPIVLRPAPALQSESSPSLNKIESFGGSAVFLKEKPSSFSLQKGAPLTVTSEYASDDDDVAEPTGFVPAIRRFCSSSDRLLWWIVCTLNLGLFLWAASRYAKPNDDGTFALWVGLFLMGNLFAGSQDHIVHLCFSLFNFIPHRWPLLIRRFFAAFWCIESIHVPTSIVGSIWIILFAAQQTLEYVRGGITRLRPVIFIYILTGLLMIILAMCLPISIRILQNRFEYTHRFLSWITLVLVWAHIFLLNVDYTPPGLTLGDITLIAPPFWMVLIITVSSIVPWANMRKIKVDTEMLSKDCAQITFEGKGFLLGPLSPAAVVRVSLSPLKNWPMFPVIYDSKVSKKTFSILVPRTDPWASHVIDHPPTKLWTRGFLLPSIMRVYPLFRSVIAVAVGPGINPVVPHLFSPNDKSKLRLLWIGPNLRETFSDGFVDRILEASPDAVIHDTKERGTVNVAHAAYRLVRKYDAEAVIVIAGRGRSAEIVSSLAAHGIAAYAGMN